MRDKPAIKVFSTCPQSRDVERTLYPTRVAEVARWSEAAGCEGMLVYTDNAIADPWLVTQLAIQATVRLSPLVAVQSAYMHPYSVAKMVSTLAALHGRRIYLNMVAGGFRNDLLALGDETPHDQRYERTVEFATIVKELVSRPDPVNFEGRYYTVKNLRLTPAVPRDCIPGITISGSSDAGMAAARSLKAIAIKYPHPSGDEAEQREEGIESGLRVGIVARDDPHAAWRVAYERFPEDRKGQVAHRLAMRISDSQWHRQLSELALVAATEDDPYWLGPFKNYQTFCPYLVGDHQRVALELRRYIDLGFSTFILDIPPSEEELQHIGIVFRAALSAPGLP